MQEGKRIAKLENGFILMSQIIKIFGKIYEAIVDDTMNDAIKIQHTVDLINKKPKETQTNSNQKKNRKINRLTKDSCNHEVDLLKYLNSEAFNKLGSKTIAKSEDIDFTSQQLNDLNRDETSTELLKNINNKYMTVFSNLTTDNLLFEIINNQAVNNEDENRIESQFRMELNYQMQLLGDAAKAPLSHSLNELRYNIKQDKPLFIKNECRSSASIQSEFQIKTEYSYIEEEMSLILSQMSPMPIRSQYLDDHQMSPEQNMEAFLEDEQMDLGQNDDDKSTFLRDSNFGILTQEKVDLAKEYMSQSSNRHIYYSSRKTASRTRKSNLSAPKHTIIENLSDSCSSDDSINDVQSPDQQNSRQKPSSIQYCQKDSLISNNQFQDSFHNDCAQLDEDDCYIYENEPNLSRKSKLNKILTKKQEQQVIDIIDDDDEDDAKKMSNHIQMILSSMNLPPLTQDALQNLQKLTTIKDLKNQLWAHITQELIEEEKKKILVQEIFGDQLERYKKQSLSHQMAFVGLLHVVAENDLTLDAFKQNEGDEQILYVQKDKK